MQTQVPKSLLYHQPPWWPQTDLCVKFVTRGSKGTKTFNYIVEAIICHGSLSKEQPLKSGRGSMFVQNLHVSITTRLEHWAILQALRNTFAENMVRKNGNVTNVPRSMQCSLIGKLIQRHVVQGNINVTVAPSSPGLLLNLYN